MEQQTQRHQQQRDDSPLEEGQSADPEGTSQKTATDQFVEDLARRTGESAERISVRRDAQLILECMKEGVIVKLHVKRPRFMQRLSLEALGLKSDQYQGISPAAEEVLAGYFQLGRRSLLPDEYQDALAAAESSARYKLKRFAIPSHWGAFIPVTVYDTWKKEHARHEQEFWDAAKAVRDNYGEICKQVLTDYREFAEDAWARLEIGTSLLQQGTADLPESVLMDLAERLHVGEGKAAFVAEYLEVVEQAMPSPLLLEDAFVFQLELSAIPLPSILAEDMTAADRLVAERAIKDAKARAELERIETERRLAARRAQEELDKIERRRLAELRKTSLVEQEERQRLLWQQRENEERRQLQRQMEADILASARVGKQRLLDEFYNNVMVHLNGLIFETTQNVLDSLDEHHGILRGRVSRQLREFLERLEAMNFVGDEQIEAQLERLRLVLPTPEESALARKGVEKINTEPIKRVVGELHREAEHILFELGTQVPIRVARERPALEAVAPLNLDGRTRKSRQAMELAQPQPQRRRSRKPRTL